MATSSFETYGIILAGGPGHRLWPLANQTLPKPLLRNYSKPNTHNLLVETIQCLLPLVTLRQLFISTNQQHISTFCEHLNQAALAPMTAQFITEPLSRNTAPAILMALKQLQETTDIKAIDCVVVVPCDFQINNTGMFQTIIKQACELSVEQKSIVTLGVSPTHADPNYGYIVLEPSFNNALPYEVSQFVEKPPKEQLECLFQENPLENKSLFWNAGLFIAPLFVLEAAFKNSVFEPWTNTSYADLYRNYTELPTGSFDALILQGPVPKLMMPIPDHVWQDFGCWDRVFEGLPKNTENNAVVGEYIAIKNSRSSLIWNETQQLIATIGIEDLMIINTPSALLVAKANSAPDLNQLLRELNENQREDNNKDTTGFVMTTLSQDIYMTTFEPGRYFHLLVQQPCRWVIKSGQMITHDKTEAMVFISGASNFIGSQENPYLWEIPMQPTACQVVFIGECPQILEVHRQNSQDEAIERNLYATS